MAKAGRTLMQLERRLTAIRRSSAVPLKEIVYRSTSPRYANERDLMTGDGSRRYGGRWNPVGIAAIYASLTPETAMAETLAHYRYYGIPVADAMPRTFVAMELNLTAVLDLCDGAIRRRIQISVERILAVDWRKEVHAGRDPITQILGRAAYNARFEAMLVPSAVSRASSNIVVFPGRVSERQVTVLNAGGLGT